MSEIQVLGTGCEKCTTLANIVEAVIQDLGIDCIVEKVTEIDRILQHGVMVTPALVIAGEVAFAGTVPSKDEVKEKVKELLADKS